MRWALGTLIAVFTLAILGIMFGPSFVDWEARKPLIADRLEKTLGVSVTLEGGVDVTLFPRPQLTVSKLQLSGPLAGIAGDTTVRWARATLTLSKLLRGEVNVTQIEIVEPFFTRADAPTIGAGSGEKLSADIQVTQDKGRVSDLQASDFGPRETGQGDERAAWLDPAANIEIFDGTIDLGTSVVSEITGRISGPKRGARLRAQLEGVFNGDAYALDLRAAVPQPSNGVQKADVPLSFRLSSEAMQASLSVSGRWRRDASGAFVGEGDVTLVGKHVASLVHRFSAPILGVFAHDGQIRMEGRVSFAEALGQIIASNLVLETDALAATGSMTVERLFSQENRPFVDLAARFSRLDFDRFVGSNVFAATAQSPTMESDAADNVANTADFEAFGDAGILASLGGSEFDAQLALSAAGARFRDTLIRSLEFRAGLEEGAITIEELSASLPGGADLSVAGFGDLNAIPPLLEGNASLIADDFRRFATWLGFPDPDVSADRLRRFSLVSGVAVQPGRFDVLGAAVEIDDVSAEMSARFSFDGPPALGLRVTIPRINLDAFRHAPATGSFAPLSTVNTGAPVVANPADLEVRTVQGLFEDLRASIDLRINEAVALGALFRNVVIETRVQNDSISLDRVAVEDLSGASFSLRGDIDLPSKEPPSIRTLVLQGRAPDFGRVFSTFNAPDELSRQFRLIGSGRVEARYETDLPPSLIDQEEGQEEGQEAINDAVSDGVAPSRVTVALEAAKGGLSFKARQFPGPVTTFAIQDGQFSSPQLSIEQASANLVLDITPGFVGGAIEEAVFTLNGAEVTGAAQLTSRERSRRLDVQYRALDFETAHQLGDLNGALGFTARLNSSGVLYSETRLTEPLGAHFAQMNGNIALTGAVSVSLGPPLSTRMRVRNVEAFQDLLRRYFTERDGSLSGTLVLEKGILSPSSLLLKGSSRSEISMQGRLSLPQGQLDADLTVSAPSQQPGALQRAVLTLQGPIARPNIALTAPVYD